MSKSSFTLGLRPLVLLTLLTTAYAAPFPAPFPYPAPFPQVSSNMAYSDPPSIATVDSPGPPAASGTLRGPASLIGYSPSEAVATEPSTVIPTSDFELAPGQTLDDELGLYLNFNGVNNFQPIRGSTDAPTDPGPRTPAYEQLNSDLYAPPGSDSGAIPNAKWPLGLSHNRHGTPGTAGWSRQQNVDQLPIAAAMAGVDMRLSPNAYRELHWHQVSVSPTSLPDRLASNSSAHQTPAKTSTNPYPFRQTNGH